MLEQAVNKFNEYIKKFDNSNKDIKLKYNHSLAVMNLMKELAFRLNLSKEEIELAGLIGLLHDIGRFYQLEKYDSYSDLNIDHAECGADYLFKNENIRNFIEDNKYDNIIEQAIRNHNKLRINENLKDEELLFSKMVRDMDKVDIYKQMAVNFDVTFKADEITEQILKDFKDEKQADSRFRKSVSDGILTKLSYIFDINFNESFDILVETDNFDLYLSSIGVEENSEKLWKKVKELCFDKINRGV